MISVGCLRLANHFRIVSKRTTLLRFASTLPADVRDRTIPQSADLDHDGVITPEEVFKMIDVNGDNVLSREEFYLACEKMEVSDLLRLRQSLARSELSRTHDPQVALDTLKESIASLWVKRLVTTLEVGISKIFPAGFGWQTGAILASGAGLAASDGGFFLATGVGDALGVFFGHSLYMAGKRVVTGDESIDVVRNEIPTGLLLGTAALCSGTLWQPLVNVFQAAGIAFTPTMFLAQMGCGLAFFGGLRIGRLLYHRTFRGIEKSSYANLKADAFLSLAVGGASGAFVGTDVSYGAQNWMGHSIGITPDVSSLKGATLAGASTTLGFTVVQLAQNSTVPAGKNWVD